ncbi:peptidylprolyl isomerase [Bathymodiolus japonicus methanotrophic gill symbiont]|uniref:peptidylprolyl isomerase n=1 Tax=Bathymodiolus japonicus methanotrophic gill symbiont TaxID=113269 RepID=UPI001E651A31|nr:peptidylprolyl isomerase [Bathymodiolus japonicus methanotrophic gill symbiont]
MRKRITQSIAILALIIASFQLPAVEYLDGIVAVVEDDIILESELAEEVAGVASKLKANNVQMPPDHILYKQVLERLIIGKLQSQLAEKAGVKVTDEMLESSMSGIARQNGMDLASFKQEIQEQGMSYATFKESVRKEIVINQLRNHEIGSRVKVSEQEIDHYMETEISSADRRVKYFLGHILISVPEGASATTIQTEEAEALSVVKQLREGADFKQMAISVSDGTNALQGGELGWRTLSQLPTLFVDVVKTMSKGDIADPVRSPGGVHILKLIDSTGVVSYMVTETQVRHILIKTNELINDEDAQKRLLAISGRIADGDDFAALAKANSDDTGPALNGGELGWVTPGLLVPPFEKAMSELEINEISEPVQTQFGWHIIQVLGRRTKDNKEQQERNQVRDEIRKRKIEEETELWLRRLRDEAYVDIRLEALNE